MFLFFFFLEFDGFNIRIFLGRETFFCPVGANHDLLFTTAFSPYNTVYKIGGAKPAVHFYIQKQVTIPSLYSNIRRVFKNIYCRMLLLTHKTWEFSSLV